MRNATVLAATMLCFSALSAASASAAQPLQTAVYADYPGEATGAETDLHFQRIRASGATVTRIWLRWAGVAPAVRPASFQADNPADPAYNWAGFDDYVRKAVNQGLEPLVTIYLAPSWAQGSGSGEPGTVRPDPTEFGRFAKAAAARYSGSFQLLPRVRYWQAWNEPNLHISLNPQFFEGRPVSPSWYRAMLNAFATAVHSVDADNLVVAAGLAPFYDNGVTEANWGPLTFMRELLCLSRDLQPTCSTPVQFDVWAHHPYTSGGPTHHARLPDDVSLADLPQMRDVLLAGVRAGHVVSREAPRFWVTEFSFDSDPPDPLGVPSELLSRWVAESLFRMWQSGVSLVTWLSLVDTPYPANLYQSGLYYRGSSRAFDVPKPAHAAFRFPFVAFRTGDLVSVWGRTPWGRAAQVVVEQESSGVWGQLGALTTDANGIFEAQFPTLAGGSLRARTLEVPDQSLPFSLGAVPDQFFNPFGLTFLLEGREPPPADFDGNGRTDIGVFRPSNGVWYVRGGVPIQWGTRGDIPVPADYNGDGTSDIAVYRPFQGFHWWIPGIPPIQWGAEGDIPTPADFNGDGRAETAVFRPSSGVWYSKEGSPTQWGTSGDVPVPADFDGDGKADFAVYRPFGGFHWFIRGLSPIQWGAEGDIPTPADFDGDGRAEIAVFRPSNGVWYVRGGSPTQWGTRGDIPTPGDFTTLGKADMAVYRPFDGFHTYVLGSPRVQWGAEGDIPLASPPAVRLAFFP